MKKYAVCFTMMIFAVAAFAVLPPSVLYAEETAAAAAGDSEAVAFVKQLQDKLQSNDLNGALSLFETMPASLSDDVNMKILQSSLLVSAGKYDEAKKIGDALQASDSSNIDILELNAQIASARGDKAGKSALISKILAIDPYNASANIQQAQEQALKKKYKIAGNYYRKALTREPDNADALFGYAQMSYYQNNLKEAESSLQKLLDKDPENAIALAYMGKLAAESENWLRATKFIQDAIKIDPKNYDFYLDLGTYLRSQGKFADAEKAWTQAIELDSTYFLAYAYRAGLYDEQGMFEKALSDYENVIRTNPKYYFAFEETGILEWHFGNWTDARKYFTKALEISPANISYTLTVAACYIKENNMTAAKTLLEKAMKPLDRQSLDYEMLRLYHDQGGINAENSVALKTEKEENTTKRGRMQYYLGLYYELKGLNEVATEYYTKVAQIKTPQFFEYRIAEWGLKK